MNKMMYKTNIFIMFLYILMYCKWFKITYNLNIELESKFDKDVEKENPF